MGSDVICGQGRLHHADGAGSDRPEDHLDRCGIPRDCSGMCPGFGVSVSPFLVDKEGSRLPRSCVKGWDASLGEDFLEEEEEDVEEEEGQQALRQSSVRASLS